MLKTSLRLKMHLQLQQGLQLEQESSICHLWAETSTSAVPRAFYSSCCAQGASLDIALGENPFLLCKVTHG